jgi:hypothetical protein
METTASEKIVALERRLNKERQGRNHRTQDAGLCASFSSVIGLNTAGIAIPTEQPERIRRRR